MTKTFHPATTVKPLAQKPRMWQAFWGLSALLAVTAVAGVMLLHHSKARVAGKPTPQELDRRAQLSLVPPAPCGDDLATLRQLREGLDRLPSKADASELTFAARQARRVGDLWYASRLLHAALQQDPTNRQARLLLADTLYTETQFDAARRIYQQLYQEDRKDASAYLGLAEVARAENKSTAMRQWMLKALHESEQTPVNLLQVADRYLDWGMFTEAEAVADWVQRIAPGHVGARLLKASLLLQRGEWDASRQILEALLPEVPQNARVYRVLAAALRHPGSHADPNRTCALFARSLELDPGDVDTLRLAGDYYRQQRLFRLAAQTYTRLLTIAPNHLEARYGLAQVYAALGQTEMGRVQSGIHKRLQATDLQAQNLREQVSMKPRAAEAHVRLARFLALQSNYANAVMEYQIAIWLLPANHPLRVELSDLYHSLGWGDPGAPL